jgi:hypothetical protein
MSSHEKSAMHALAAARSARNAGDALDALATAMATRDYVGACAALTQAMNALMNLESDLGKVRDFGLMASSSFKTSAAC